MGFGVSGFKVSGFQGFRVSGFQVSGFKSGVSGSQGFRVSGFLCFGGFMISGIRVQATDHSHIDPYFFVSLFLGDRLEVSKAHRPQNRTLV